jgi:hypothetical protein
MTDAERDALIDEGHALSYELSAKTKRFKEITGALCSLEAGNYESAAGKIACVIRPGPALKPKEAAIDATKKMLKEEHFKLLFDWKAIWKPVKNCRDVAARILTAAKLKKFLSLCEVESTPYVIFQ